MLADGPGNLDPSVGAEKGAGWERGRRRKEGRDRRRQGGKRDVDAGCRQFLD